MDRSDAAQSRDTVGKRLDRLLTIKSAELKVVGPLLARRQGDQLAALAGVEATGDPVRARFDADDVGPFAEHPPDEVARELLVVEDLVGAESARTVDDGDGHAAVRLRDH